MMFANAEGAVYAHVEEHKNSKKKLLFVLYIIPGLGRMFEVSFGVY